MSVSSVNGIINIAQNNQKPQKTTDFAHINQSSDINLNDILADLNIITKVVNNLTIALSVYLNQRGELDTKRFKLVSMQEQGQ